MQQIQGGTISSEYADAFRSVRSARTAFSLLILLAILVQLAGFVLVEFVGVLDPLHTEESAATAPAEGAEVQGDSTVRARTWEYALRWVLPAMKFTALVSTLLLSLTLLLAVKLSLVGRLGGVAGFVSAMFWSLILFVTIVPWQHVLNSAVACGALYNLGELVSEKVRVGWNADPDATQMVHYYYYLRFVVYPVAALAVWLIVCVKFSLGCKRMHSIPVAANPQADDSLRPL